MATLPGEEKSPLGPVFGDDERGDFHHGYHFKLLKAQEPDVIGGAYDCRIKGRMTAGLALVAWSATYGETGVMSFVVSHDGQLYERDLGPDTEAAARATTRFDPDVSW